MENPVTTSIVVASHRGDLVKNLVEALALQCRDREYREVIVVADYPVDNHQNLYPWVRWLEIADTSISLKRNAGVTKARGNVIGFTDDDCRPRPEWIDSAERYLKEHGDMAGVEGKTIVPADPSEPGLTREFRRLEKPGFRTNNIFYRKDVFSSVGGFDERFTVQREDIDLAFTVLANGYRLGYDNSIVVEHEVRTDAKWDLLKNCINRRFDPLLYKKHPRNYRDWVGSPVPRSLLAIALLYLIALASLLVYPAVFPATIAAVISVIFLLGWRRSRKGTDRIASLIREWCSFAAAPFVVGYALVYGSLRYRKLLFF